MGFTKHEFERLLKELNDFLEEDENDDAVFPLVCGASALQIHNLTDRATRDIDVLARIQFERDKPMLKSPNTFSQNFKDFVDIIAEENGLSPDWLNSDIGAIPIKELPVGFNKRWKKVKYGKKLTVYYLGRLDLICLKFLAASAPKAQEKHLNDILEYLKPSEDEIKYACEWCERQGAPKEVVAKMAEVLSKNVG